MNKPLAIYGAGGLGREVLSLLRLLPEWEVVGFYDDGLRSGTSVKEGLKVIGGFGELIKIRKPLNIVLSFGLPEIKQRLSASLKVNEMIHFPVLVHPSVILQDRASIVLDPGCIIGAGSILTTDIHLHPHVLINLNCTLGHDVEVGACSSVMPGVNLAGEVNIGEGVLIGSGANIINRIAIGSHSKIGAGAVVIKSVPPHVTAVGVPARIIKS